MYKLSVRSQANYHDEITYIFNDFNEMVSFMEVSLKKSEYPVKVTIELVERDGEQNDGN